jgi:hypothetical protein
VSEYSGRIYPEVGISCKIRKPSCADNRFAQEGFHFQELRNKNIKEKICAEFVTH